MGDACRDSRGVARANFAGDRFGYFSTSGIAAKVRAQVALCCVQSADFVVTGCHAAFFTSYSVELGFFRSPVFVNAIVPVMPS